jgi:chemotaxis-related protein WspD
MNTDGIHSQGNEASTDACWRSIGSWGKQQPRCERLAQLAHCVNCDVYQTAGRRMLDRAPPGGYLEEWREALARPLEVASTTADSYVVFERGPYWFALQTRLLQHAADVAVIHSLPHNRAAALLGVANVRGVVSPCIDLAAMLREQSGAQAPDTTPASRQFTRFLVAGDAQRCIFPADRIVGLQRFEAGQIVDCAAEAALAVKSRWSRVCWRAQDVYVVDPAQVSVALAELTG